MILFIVITQITVGKNNGNMKTIVNVGKIYLSTDTETEVYALSSILLCGTGKLS